MTMTTTVMMTTLTTTTTLTTMTMTTTTTTTLTTTLTMMTIMTTMMMTTLTTTTTLTTITTTTTTTAMMMMMVVVVIVVGTSRGLFVRRWLFTLITLLNHSSVLSDPLGEKLFFQHPVSETGSQQVVQAGEDVILECEASGRPSPIISWEFDGVPLNPVYYIHPSSFRLICSVG